MKRKPNNPRQISKREFERLAADLERFGDLGGVVHNETTGNFVGGNQRSSVFELERQGAQITVTETYAEPTRTGTVARGYVEWRGERYDYRRVRWDTETEDAACLVANLRGGTWDFDALSAWDGDLLKGIGFDGDLLAAWNDQAANLRELLESEKPAPVEDAGAQVDKAEELREKWGVETGQLWQLGEHRLICGDCTDRAVVERVMGGEKARTIFTDPPYGIGKEIINDNLRREDWLKFYELFTANMLDFAITNAYVFVWGYFEGLSDYWQEIVKPRGDCNFRNFIIWKKSYIQGRNVKDFRQFPENYAAALLYIFGQPFQNGPWSTSPNAEYYPEIFEPIRAYLDGERQKMGWDIPTVKKIVNHSDLARDHWFGRSQWSMPTREVYQKLQLAARNNAFRKEYDELRKEYDELRKEYDELRGYFDNSHNFTDLWEFEKLTTDNRHPTVKPVEVCERGIISTSQKGEIVLDVFLGSGSTLIACERLGRRCRAVEISPAYVAVAIQRWVDVTGGEPVLLNDSEIR